ncbi:uncharacterized protein LOC108952694 isoform X2 [Musa acuminata AAA Group]|uniref:uncharacterized protein LOC108952694 isoform X2 n=1 Tax=Musa acuminata AAA Group TaxID=214697 RepID=UPI0008A0A822|nr:PREDICTED: uncharacterized protein LOC108952694 [Musa acuminata subsp. malaccensis]
MIFLELRCHSVSQLSTLVSQPEAVHFEINTAYEEPLISLEASQGEGFSKALAEFSTMESPQYTGGTAGVRRAGKFQPENISQPNKGTAKSVSFISSEASDSVIPSVGSFSETMDISSVQMMTDVHEDDPLHSVSTIPDCIAGFRMDHMIGSEKR